MKVEYIHQETWYSLLLKTKYKINTSLYPAISPPIIFDGEFLLKSLISYLIYAKK